MKRAFSLALMAMFGLALVGCHAEGEIDDNDSDRDMTYKKTTHVDDDGSRTVKTEKKVD